MGWCAPAPSAHVNLVPHSTPDQDNYARGLLNAARLIEDAELDEMVRHRYGGWSKGIGKRVAENDPTLTLSDLASHAHKIAEPAMASGKHEKYESIFNHFSTRS